MLRPSFHRKIPPSAEADCGGSFHPSVYSIPLIRCTIRSPPTPVPYSRQHLQRANRMGSNGIFGASFSHVSQSRFCGERSSGGGYCHAPLGSLRPRESSTNSTSPMAPSWYNPRALEQRAELTRCDPICTIRLLLCAASTMANPC